MAGVYLFGLFLIAFFVFLDTQGRGMNGFKWAAAVFLCCIPAFPLYMSVRFRDDSKDYYTKKQLRIGILIFASGLIGLLILSYKQLFIPFHFGELKLLELTFFSFIALFILYIYSFLSIYKKDMGKLALGFFLVLITFGVHDIANAFYNDINYEYIVSMDNVNISGGVHRNYTEETIIIEDLVNNNRADIVLEGRDTISESDMTGLFYKNGSLAPFEGIYISVNEDKSSIRKALFYENGVRYKSIDFINDYEIEEVDYYLDRPEQVKTHRLIDNSSKDSIVRKTEYYKSGQIQSIMELEVPNIFYGKYEDYYENGQLKREILPYNGNLQGWTYNRGKRINIKDGKIVYYNQNGEHDETRIYINGEIQ